MDSLNAFRDIIEKTLLKHSGVPGGQGEMEVQTIFDRQRDHYLLVTVGWTKHARIHGVLAHIDLIGEKAWVQTDGTEDGLARELVEEGVLHDRIVLGYRLPEIRKHTGFALG